MPEKIPVNDPLVVKKLAVVGLEVVAQQMPLTVTAEPPLDVILPPETADVSVIDETGVVEMEGAVIVVNVISFP